MGKQFRISSGSRKVLIVFGLISLLLMSTLLHWSLRTNDAEIHPELVYDRNTVVDDGTHNSNTDLIQWNGTFWMVYATSPFHMGSSESELIIQKSANAHEWEIVHSLNLGVKDVRDPKFAIINDTLFLYALENEGLVANPYRTVYSTSVNGIEWSEFSSIPDTEGWLFWRPFMNESGDLYVPAYWHEHGKSALFKSINGTHWQQVSIIHEEGGVDETACEFRSDNSMICTVRVEGKADTIIGRNSGGTSIAVAQEPYIHWNHTRDEITRLDGPNLFNVGNETFAIGRYQPEQDSMLFQMGGVLSKKRTSLYIVEETGLTYISDLPSAGDTSYAGVVLDNGTVFTCYYTSDTDSDYPWIIGMLASSNIELVELNATSLLDASKSPLSSEKNWPVGEYVILIVNIVLDVIIVKRFWRIQLLSNEEE